MIRVGRIPYINVLPIFEGLKHLDIDLSFVEWEYAPPAKLSHLFNESHLDVSFLSLGSYFEHQHEVSPLSSFGITALQYAHSVCLYTRVPLWELHHKPLYVTSQSQTSISLLQVLCKQYWNVHPHFFLLNEEPTKDMDAYLLIGDTCLNHTPDPSYTCIDLAHAWYLATALPFTFALLVQRNDLTDNQKDEVKTLTNALHISHQWFLSHQDKVAKIASSQSIQSQPFFNKYFSDLKYLLDDKAHKAIHLFHKLSTQSKKKVYHHA